MTKKDIVMKISEDTGLKQIDVKVAVQKTLDYITGALAMGNTVELRNFGVFKVKTRKPRIGRKSCQVGSAASTETMAFTVDRVR